jgi:16S rRNA (cytidine1402-2'-O)-methyltransferase
LAPGLYVVATPIGNLRDITLRALDVLAGAAVIAAEDTRVTATLLRAYGLSTPLLACHDHNMAELADQLVGRAAREPVALVTDAGTPLISDPGFVLVRAARAAGIPVYPIPGACAAIAALSVAGLPAHHFLFVGFLPAKATARRAAIADLAGLDATLLLYEAPSRVADTLHDLAAGLGDRPAVLARELTKRFEQVRSGTLSELATGAVADPPRGEIVLVIGPPDPTRSAKAADDLDAQLQAALAAHSLKDAVAAVAATTGVPRKQVYARALALSAARP